MTLVWNTNISSVAVVRPAYITMASETQLRITPTQSFWSRLIGRVFSETKTRCDWEKKVSVFRAMCITYVITLDNGQTVVGFGERRDTYLAADCDEIKTHRANGDHHQHQRQ